MFGRRSSNSKVNLDLEDSLIDSINQLDKLAVEGSNIETQIDNSNLQQSKIESEIETLADEISDVESQINELEKQLLQIKSIKSSLTTEISDALNEQDSIRSKIEGLNKEVDSLAESYSKVGKEHNELRVQWNEKLSAYKPLHGTISKWKSFGDSIVPSKIYALGDLHGWAPGLINLIHAETGFVVEMLGHELDKSMVERRFPNPLDSIRGGRHLPRVGMNGNPLRKATESTPYEGLYVSSEDHQNLILQVGDLIDRGDHNEIILELMRQIMIKSPGSALSLIGNHEAWLIEGDFATWKTNEDRFRMHGRPRPGTTIHDPLMTGADSLDESMQISFNILEGALGALLLTQHFSMLEGMDYSDSKKFSEIYSESFRCLPMSIDSLRKSTLKGGWELHELGRSILNIWRYESKNQEILVPGAYNLISVAKNVFCHAEPNGLCHSMTDLGKISDIFRWCGQDLQFIFTRMSNSRILDLPLLQARSKGDKEEVLEGLVAINSVLPGIESYIHGHTPHNEDPVTNYNLKVLDVTVVNCDVGITPIYRSLRHDNPYDTSIVPYTFEINLEVDEDE